MELKDFSIKQLIDEINSRTSNIDGNGLLNSTSNNKIYNLLKDNENLSIGISMTLGYPDTLSHDKYKCSRCHEKKDYTKFSFYLSRIDSDGYLMRSNAICDTCSNEQNKKRQKILNEANDKGLIPDKPNSGDICEGCGREWHGNWHRHHDDKTHEFISWLCGHCNMSQSDQRGVFGK